MKKYIALALCLIMIVSCFVGCGKKADEEVDLVVWTNKAEGTPAYDVTVEMIEKFEESRGVNLEVQHYGSDLGTILGTALESGERVDVFALGSQQQLAANIKYTMDITNYVTESDVLDRAYPICMDIIMDQSENDAEYHAIPTTSSFNSFWYNKAAFEAAGITENPTTIEEFEAVCDALVAAGYNPIAQDAGYIISLFGALVERYVGEATATELTLNGGFAENENFIAACDKILEWVDKGYFDPDSPSEWPASQNKIGLTEENVMVYCGAWVSGEIEEMTGAELEWGCFKFPELPGGPGTYGTSVSCTCNCINVNCENPDLAWDYLYYMCTGEVDKAITDADVYLVDDRTQEALPRFADAREIMESTETNMNYAGGLHSNADIKTSMNDTVIGLYTGKYADGLAAAQAFDALLK
ncbi:MAG: extracellular solute-binding protein [Oscillospiraceae bacterium]|nr:extracellular solute-binding protein [Oscillospiraceae bacterium]